MKLSALFVAATLLLGETAVFAGNKTFTPYHPHRIGRNVQYMEMVSTKEPQAVDPFNSLRTPVGPTDNHYGNERVW